MAKKPASKRNKLIAKKLTYADASITSDILGLASVHVCPGRVMTWTKTQIKQAERWAGAVHFRASDNDVEVPPMPEFLKPFQADAGMELEVL